MQYQTYQQCSMKRSSRELELELIFKFLFSIPLSLVPLLSLDMVVAVRILLTVELWLSFKQRSNSLLYCF